MHWIENYDLFLFDFDGLLIDSEKIHYQAYANVLEAHGEKMPWNFYEFLQRAHAGRDELKESVESYFPQLFETTSWQQLYEEKKSAYLSLLSGGKVELLPGVEQFLKALHCAKKESCVVTNSFKEQTDLVRKKIPSLSLISHWITREDYEKQKPDPDSYLRAIALYGKGKKEIIGFEDSLRGIRALKNTPATAVLICPGYHPLLPSALEEATLHYESMEEILESL